ncbi:hypothetical protein [Pseudomonas sp. NFIX10]|uniref:hypothetical protein n=1 Tax=unclassified Pseudomonas TaxID=196821 RepID=UPI000AF4AF19
MRETFGTCCGQLKENRTDLCWGTFGGSLSLFRIEQPQGVLGGDGYYRVDAEQRNRGVELSLFGEPFDGLLLRTGGQFVDSANDYSIPAWTRVDLGARYRTKMEGRALTFNAMLENVADESYWASANGGYLTQGAPRTLKVSATVDF